MIRRVPVKMVWSTALVCVLCVGWTPDLGLRAQEMNAEKIRQKVIAALGGDEALAAVKSLRIEGRYATNSRFVRQTVLRQRQHHYRLERGSWRKGRETERVSEGLDGDSGWAFDPTAESPGAQAVDADRLVSLRAQASFYGGLVEKPPASQLELIGLEETELGELWRLRLAPAEGPEETWLVDPETYLPVALYTERWDWGRLREIRIYYDDWRSVGGVLWPFTVEDEFSSFHRMLRVESVEINPELASDAFAPPAVEGSSKP